MLVWWYLLANPKMFSTFVTSTKLLDQCSFSCSYWHNNWGIWCYSMCLLPMWKVPSYNLCSSCQAHEWFAYPWLNYYWPKSCKVLSIWDLSMYSLDTHRILVQRAHTTNTNFRKCKRKCSPQTGMEIKLIVGNLKTIVVKE